MYPAVSIYEQRKRQILKKFFKKPNISAAGLWEKLKKGAKLAWAPTIIVTGIFFLNYFCFTPANASIGPVLALLFNKYRNRNGRYECLIMDFLVCEVLAVAAFAASLHIALNIVVNAVVFFWIACVYINDYSPANHFPIGIAYIFFQISPASDLGSLGTRALALVVSFSILMLFLIVYTAIFSDHNAQKRLLEEGFENCARQLELKEEDEAARKELQNDLQKISVRCCKDIWEFNRSVIRPRNKVNCYCRYIVFFIIFNYLMDDPGNSEDRRQAEKMYERYLNDFQNLKPHAVYKRLRFRLEPLGIHNFRVCFALREAIVLVPCIAFASLSGLENVYWMVLCAFFLVTPYSDLSADKVRRRVIGTIVGVVLCQIAFPLLPNFMGRAVLMTVANFFSYFGGGYDMAVICITCAVTALSEINGAVSTMLLQRLIYNLIGAGIAVLANKFIFSIHTVNNLEYASEYADRLLGEIGSFAREVTHEDHPDRPELYSEQFRFSFSKNGHKDPVASSDPEDLADLKRDVALRKEMDQRIVSLFMLQERMEELDATLPEEDRHADTIEHHRRNMMEIAEVFARRTLDEA